MLQAEGPVQKISHPKRHELFFHGVKTFKLVGSLVKDPRVPIARKLLFFGAIGALIVVMFFPDLLSEFVLSTVLPVVGTVTGIPIDAGMDWLAFAFVVVNLFRFFPSEVVSEHYRRIFKSEFPGVQDMPEYPTRRS